MAISRPQRPLFLSGWLLLLAIAPGGRVTGLVASSPFFLRPSCPGAPAFSLGQRSSLKSSPSTLRSSRVDSASSTGGTSSSTGEGDSSWTASSSASLTPGGLLRRDRYVATNRFAVRPGKAAKFEQRWATRKSRLAELPGFRYFHLMRRVRLQGAGGTSWEYDGGDESDDAAQENYVSLTVWDKKSDFSAWRKGDAFKEAHGGTSIGAFLSTLVNSALVLRGPPRPAFYDGLLVRSVPPASAQGAVVDGWRQVAANGVDPLPAECWVEWTKYCVASDQAGDFEHFWDQQQQSQLGKSTEDAVLASALLRRDGQAKGHGAGSVAAGEPTYVGVVIRSEPPPPSSFPTLLPAPTTDVPPGLLTRDPETVYYQGTLVLSGPQGA